MIDGVMPLCPWESPTYFIFSSNAYPLFYYAHFVPIIVGGSLVGILLWRNASSLAIRVLAIVFAISSIWILADLVSTATNRPDVVLFLWSSMVLIEPLLFAAAFFLFSAFAFDRLPSFRSQVAISVLIAPLIALAPTAYNVVGIYIKDCNAAEGFIASQYSYAVEILLTVGILLAATQAIVRTRDSLEKRKLIIFLVGLMAFLVSFASGNIVGSVTGDWVSAQYGLFGLPIFIGFLGYIIVRFSAFDVKVIGAQAQVIALALLVFSLLFVNELKWVFIVAGGTFLLVCTTGWFLVRGVRREIEQRELIEAQEKALQTINAQQENLLHFMSHEIKGYLTNSEAGFASIVEGDYGEVSPQLKTMSQNALINIRKGVTTVMDILKASDMKKGTVAYRKDPVNLKTLLDQVIAQQKPAFDEKHLSLDVKVEGEQITIKGDQEKLRDHVLRNLIDNALKYTPSGTVTVELTSQAGKVHFSVKDSGVGITPEDMARLFTEGGHGKDSIKVNVHSTGYGLFIAKQVVEAHGGKIWAESEGDGKGSKFVVELPAA